MQTLKICSYASILAKSICLPVQDLLCTSRTPSCAHTLSIHSTPNLKVACGMNSVCALPYFYSYRGVFSSFEHVVPVSPIFKEKEKK